MIPKPLTVDQHKMYTDILHDAISINQAVNEGTWPKQGPMNSMKQLLVEKLDAYYMTFKQSNPHTDEATIDRLVEWFFASDEDEAVA